MSLCEIILGSFFKKILKSSQMRKETLALILLECLLCLAQSGPPMGPPMMGPPNAMPFDALDQIVGAPPSGENEYHYQGYYLTGDEQNLGAPPPPDMGAEQQYQGYHYRLDDQMVGGPLEDFFHVSISN